MSVKITCPECSAVYPIAAGLLDDDGKRLAALTGEMEPTLARAALSYLKFFKPEKTALRTARALTILQELHDLVRVGTVCKDERGGIRRPANYRTWIAGIEHMHQLDGRLRTPLANHNYLRSIVFGIADGEDAKQEQSRDRELRQPRQTAREEDETLAWLDDQRRRGFITEEKYTQAVATRKRILESATSALPPVKQSRANR